MASECPLRKSELKVIAALTDGSPVKVAARRVNLTPDAVNARLQMCRRIVGVKNTTALVAKAIREGWIK